MQPVRLLEFLVLYREASELQQRYAVRKTKNGGRLRSVRYQVIFAHPQGLNTKYR